MPSNTDISVYKIRIQTNRRLSKMAISILKKPRSNQTSVLVAVGKFVAALAISSISLTSTAQSPDPWDTVNRRTFAFNDFFDQLIVRPVAVTYTTFMPRVARQGIGNFFSNIDDVNVLVNNVLQLKFGDAAGDTGRLLLNSTVGLGGVFDVATGMGLKKHEEDFGQTLGFWGIGAGPYVVLPIFGASNMRDSVGLVLDTLINPIQYQDDSATRLTLFALRETDTRASLLALDELLGGDKYLFIREAYIQRRDYLVNDGQIDDGFGSF